MMIVRAAGLDIVVFNEGHIASNVGHVCESMHKFLDFNFGTSKGASF